MLFLPLILAPLAAAHFVVQTPPPLGSNIDNEDEAPRGGFTPSTSDNLTGFHVGGDAIAVTTLHAQSSFAFLGMLGDNIDSPTWTLLIPSVVEYGLNGFCEPDIAVPASWAGSSGLLQIIQDAEDGVHYQHPLTRLRLHCMHVAFVAGVGTANSACANSSGVSAQFAAEPVLSTADVQAPTAQSIAPQVTSSSTSSSMSSGQASPSPAKSATAPVTRLEARLGSTLWIVGLWLLIATIV